MKRNLKSVLVLVLFFLLIAAPLIAQEGEGEQETRQQEEGINVPLWHIEAHDPDPEVAQEQIVDLIEQGMLPVGIEYRPGFPIVVMYGINLGNLVTEVTFYTFEDLSQVNGGVREFIDNGFAPVGLSRHDEGLTFLFIKGALKVGRWGIVSAKLNLPEIESGFASLTADGFSPWGMTVWQDTMLLLAVEETGRQRPRDASVQLYTFEPNSYTPAISSAMKEGLYPWGIAVNAEELYVQYTRESPDREETEE